MPDKRPILDTIPLSTARRFYDRLGARHDLGGRSERAAKELALAQLAAAPGERVLNVGAGTGKEQRLLQDAVGATGRACAVDISRTMLRLTRSRAPRALLCEAQAQALPFAARSFDRLLSTYVLDLIPLTDIPRILAECRRVLRPGGRLVLVSLTEGVNLPSRLVVGLWKTAYAVHPLACGGCRPLQLTPLLQDAGFTVQQRQVLVQLGVPSEIITAERP